MKQHTKDVLDECTLALTRFGYTKKRRGAVFRELGSDMQGYIMLQAREADIFVRVDLILAIEWPAVSRRLRAGLGPKLGRGNHFLATKFLYNKMPFLFEEGWDLAPTRFKLVSFAIHEATERLPVMMDKQAIRESALSMAKLGGTYAQRLVAIDWEMRGREAAEATFQELMSSDMQGLFKQHLEAFWGNLTHET